MSEIARATREEALRRVDRIRGHVASAWEEVILAYKHRDHEALGYGPGKAGWDEYIVAEFGESRLSLPKHQRVSHVIEASSAGMSNRAIATAAGVTEGTVRNDLQSQVRNNYAPPQEPADRTGMDGKTYTRSAPSAVSPAQPAPKSKPVDMAVNFEQAIFGMNLTLSMGDPQADLTEYQRNMITEELERVINRVKGETA